MSNSAQPETANQFYINAKHERRMGTYNPDDERYHPEYKERNPSFELNETQFFGFSVPEERIHALTYNWAHPNLDLVSAGVFVAQGMKPFAPAFEICDYRAYLPISGLPKGLLSYETIGGYSVEVIDPGKLFRTTYLDQERNNSFDVYHHAIYEPCVWSNETHLEQVMRTEGEVVLRGKRYDVNGTHIRDRSWGEIRSEMPRNVPPITWMSGVFEDGAAFHVTATDDPRRKPVWVDHFQLTEEETLKFGWIIIDNVTTPIVKCSKITRYDANFFPSHIEMELTDQLGRQFHITGEMVAGFPFNAWHNCRWPICMTRWTCGDRSGWGEAQDGQWTDFLLKVM